MGLRRWTAALLLLLAAAGCAHLCRKQDHSDVATRVARFPYAFYDREIPPSFDAEQLVSILEASPPYADSIRTIRKDWALRARPFGGSYLLLVCTLDGKRAILQDLGCTPGRVDDRLWETAPDHACAFDLPPADACERRP